MEKRYRALQFIGLVCLLMSIASLIANYRVMNAIVAFLAVLLLLIGSLCMTYSFIRMENKRK